ncbi:MAG: hypothetical protein RL012_315 [Bacteroidota bacterium]
MIQAQRRPMDLVPRTSGDTKHRRRSRGRGSCSQRHRGPRRKTPQQQPDSCSYLPYFGIGCRSKEHLRRDDHPYGRDAAKLRSLPLGHLAAHKENPACLHAQQPIPFGRHTSRPDCQEVHLASSTPNKNYQEIVRLTLFGLHYHKSHSSPFYRPPEGFL